MPVASKFALRVTAGSQYTKHEHVPVNTNKPIKISTDEADIDLIVRIKDYRSPANTSLPTSCSYFEQTARQKTRYSIFFSFVPKKDIISDALVLGNDFDEPIKKYLPPFFGSGLDVVKKLIDPGLDGDPYADKPWLYGPLVSSVNVMRVGQMGKEGGDYDTVLEEGADGDEANKIRTDAKLPKEGSARQKLFLSKEKRNDFVFGKGRRYSFDFFNGYLDFNEFALKLPMGVTFNLLRQMGDQKIPPLRYVLRDRVTDTLLFHVTFALVELEAEGERKSNVESAKSLPQPSEDDVD